MLVALTFTVAMLSVLLVAAVGKLASRDAGGSMASAVAALWPLAGTPGPAAARVLGLVALGCEVALGCGLGIGLVLVIAAQSAWAVFLAVVASALLFGIFAAVEFLALRRGRRPVCACFGVRSTPISAVGAGRTAVLAGIGFAAAALWALAPSGAIVTAIDIVLPLCLGFVLGAVLVGAEDIADILRPTPAPARRT